MNTIQKLRSSDCKFLNTLAKALNEYGEVDIKIYLQESDGVFTFGNPNYERPYILEFLHITRCCYKIRTDTPLGCSCPIFPFQYGLARRERYFDEHLIKSIKNKLPENLILSAKSGTNRIGIKFSMPDIKPQIVRDFRQTGLHPGRGDFRLGNTIVWRDMLIVYGGLYFRKQWESGLKFGDASGNYRDYISLVYYGSVEKPANIVELYKECDYFCDDYGKTWCHNYMVKTRDLLALKELDLLPEKKN
jgi:hypothetical protein